MIRPKTKLELEIQAQKDKGILTVVSGASSGVGKDSVVKGLRKKHSFDRVVTYTTRKIRQGEENKVDYNFISKQEFEEKIKKGFFLEHITYLDNHYGTPKKDVIDKIKKRKRRPFKN